MASLVNGHRRSIGCWKDHTGAGVWEGGGGGVRREKVYMRTNLAKRERRNPQASKRMGVRCRASLLAGQGSIVSCAIGRGANRHHLDKKSSVIVAPNGQPPTPLPPTTTTTTGCWFSSCCQQLARRGRGGGVGRKGLTGIVCMRETVD